MKKTASTIITAALVPLIVLGVTKTYASTSVKIENNGDGSSSHVSVNSHTSTSNSSTSVVQSNSHSKVTITCNGKTYTYESDGDINENPCEGAKVNINNNGSVQGVTSIATPNPTEIKEQIEQKKAEVKKKVDEEKAKIKATVTPQEDTNRDFDFDLGAWIRSFISSIFKNL